MRLRPAGEGEVQLSVGHRERAVLALVVHGTVRRALAIPQRNTIGVQLDASLAADLFAQARYGWFRTITTVGEGTLSRIQEELSNFGEEGIQDELAANPAADPVRLGRIVQRAGRIAMQIDAFMQTNSAETSG